METPVYINMAASAAFGLRQSRDLSRELSHSHAGFPTAKPDRASSKHRRRVDTTQPGRLDHSFDPTPLSVPDLFDPTPLSILDLFDPTPLSVPDLFDPTPLSVPDLFDPTPLSILDSFDPTPLS
ncbi:hypothetical protein Bbelb_097960, partial [Branchiostoma belcheri]